MTIVGKWSLNGNANAQVGSNGTPTSVTWVDGKMNGAGSFNGSTSKINLGNIFNFSGTTNFSIEALIYYTGDGGYIISKFAPGISGQWILYTSNINTFSLHREISPFGIQSSAVLENNKWNYIVATYNGTQVRLYHNGNLVGGPTNSGSIASNTRNVMIGSSDNNSEYYQGLIDEVIVHNVALTQTEIKNKYLSYNGFI